MGVMKKILVSLLVFLAVIIIVLRFSAVRLNQYFNDGRKAGLKVLSQPEGAKVFLGDKELGNTPFESQDLSSAEDVLKISTSEATWAGHIKLNGGTLTVVNRELSKKAVSSAGEVLTLNAGGGVTVVSTPSGADVVVDGKVAGKTPVSFSVETGEHTFTLSHESYLKRSIRAYVPDNYNLTINADLAISEPDLAKINTEPIMAVPQVIVKNTPTGFLRVRDKPSLSGIEVERVVPGDKLILLEEMGNWDRVRLPEGKEGYVATAYVKKAEVTQAPK